MKKIAYTLMALCLISACSEQKEPEQETTKKTGFEDIVFAYKAGELSDSCIKTNFQGLYLWKTNLCNVQPK